MCSHLAITFDYDDACSNYQYHKIAYHLTRIEIKFLFLWHSSISPSPSPSPPPHTHVQLRERSSESEEEEEEVLNTEEEEESQEEESDNELYTSLTHDVISAIHLPPSGWPSSWLLSI